MKQEYKITTFREIAEWIFWDLDTNYNLKKDSEGNFFVNKLGISKTHLSYKKERYEISPGLFEKVEKLYELMNEDMEV